MQPFTKQLKHLFQEIREKYYKQLYANKFNNLNEIEEFLERYQLPKLNEEYIPK